MLQISRKLRRGGFMIIFILLAFFSTKSELSAGTKVCSCLLFVFL